MVQQLDGWGRYHPVGCKTLRPESPVFLTREVNERGHASYIARGMGRSYGDSAVSATGAVVLQDRLNRVIDFDEETGALECEAGTSLGDVIETFLPRGYFPAVTPGTKFVTVGGAIAADVHGKNHHVDGAFSNFVDRFSLLTADGRVLDCSREDHPDLFWATIGGMGLTGIILKAHLRLREVETAYIDVNYRKAKNLDEAIELFEATSDAYRYSVAWIDCLATGAKLGRSVLIQGNHARQDQLVGEMKARPLEPALKRSVSVPFDFPGFVLNRWSVKAFNAWYYRWHSDRNTIEDYNTFFYPLDTIGHWNRIYGKRGFIQYQALLPPDTARAGTGALLEAIAAAGMASFLSVFKKTGPATMGLLSFPLPGYTLALDLPNTGKRLTDLVARLDAITLEHGGRLYLAKDSTMSAETMAAMYPRLDEFRALKSQVDPEGVFMSDQAERLGLGATTERSEQTDV
jgi:FAD/FMN-containing dehydrogenase